mmetsp:Transcript_56343/g.182982  ORF Transcript_56343/g.182982 Transcript_56343/m.182982 type:complete len:269 (-) Transcript_56343:3935-4741(-)
MLLQGRRLCSHLLRIGLHSLLHGIASFPDPTTCQPRCRTGEVGMLLVNASFPCLHQGAFELHGGNRRASIERAASPKTSESRFASRLPVHLLDHTSSFLQGLDDGGVATLHVFSRMHCSSNHLHTLGRGDAHGFLQCLDDGRMPDQALDLLDEVLVKRHGRFIHQLQCRFCVFAGNRRLNLQPSGLQQILIRRACCWQALRNSRRFDVFNDVACIWGQHCELLEQNLLLVLVCIICVRRQLNLRDHYAWNLLLRLQCSIDMINLVLGG